MQADEIIQQKEWHELSAAERETVKELADTESEYNLLKKMLQVSAEEAVQVPVVGTHVKEKLITIMSVKKISYKRYFYAAAAVILVLLVAAIFLKKGNDTETQVALNDTSTKKAPQQIVQTMTDPKDTTFISPVKKDTVASMFVQKNKPATKPLYDVPPNDVPNDPPVYASVSKTISQEKELLELVSEMY